MPTKPTDQTLKEIVLAKLRFGLHNYMSPALLESVNVDVINDFITDHLVIAVRGWLYSRKILHETETQITETVRYPATWFEALKERWFPRSLLRKFPVKYVKKNVTITYNHTHIHTCPHINTKTQGSHISYLATESCPTARNGFKNPPNKRPWATKIMNAITKFELQARTPTLILVTPQVYRELIIELDMRAIRFDRTQKMRLFGVPLEISETIKDYQVLGE